MEGEGMAQEVTDVRKEMRAYVEENFLYLHVGLKLADGDQFLTLGIVDSLSFVELVEEIQNRYGIVIEDVEITEENLGSIDAITAFVAGKQATG
jgi:acyl carrier protein